MLKTLASMHLFRGFFLSSSKNEEDTKKLNKGDAIKQGDVLALIADMEGLTVWIKVNELVVNQLKVGQKATITGIAFPEHTLYGEIKRVDHQGEPSIGGMPMFPVEIVVSHLSKEQQRDIHVGMSAKVEINIENKPSIVVPVAAVKERDGEAYVQKIDPKTGKAHEVSVKTGKTTLDSVAILAGLGPGETIVLPH